MWYDHTMQYHSETKEHFLLIRDITRMKPENILPFERSQMQKMHILKSHLYETSQKRKFIETQSKSAVP